MKTIPVLISINASAHRDYSGEEPMAMLTSGELCVTPERMIVRYEETLDESAPPQPIELTVTDDSITMARGGDYETSMVFTKGQRFEGQYKTPFGSIALAVYCTRLKSELTREGGLLSFSYQLDLNGQFASMNDMELRIIPQTDDE